MIRACATRLCAGGLLVALAGCATTSPPLPETPARETPEVPPASAPPAAPEVPPPAAEAAAAGTPVRLCPMTVVNAPAAGADGVVAMQQDRVSIGGRALRLVPARGVCVSSGFGTRNGRPHRGVDFYPTADEAALAAGAGAVRVLTTRDDYGNMVVLDHGGDVFTVYGHLDRFAEGLKVGDRVADGAPLGVIGETGRATVRHLHYEIRTGDWREPAGVFGLEAKDPFSLPRVAAES